MTIRWVFISLYALPVLVAALVYSKHQQQKRYALGALDESSREWLEDIEVLSSSTSAWKNGIVKESSVDKRPSSQTTTIHVVVLVHGWLGNSLEMEYLRQSLRQAALQEDPSHQRFVIHSAISNQGQTQDGIAAGGKRLANEINVLIQHLYEQETANLDSNDGGGNVEFTLSLVGNSLGGLYARYAVSEIDWNPSFLLPTPDKQGQEGAKHDTPPTTTVTIRPRFFVTTCTPHLGVGSHTYLPLPRLVEYPIASALQQTGQDLFRFSNVLDDMTMNATFVEPLQAFTRRWAYVNVHGTDFQVPTATAAFWAHTESLHDEVEGLLEGEGREARSRRRQDDNMESDDDSSTSIVLQLQTRAEERVPTPDSASSSSKPLTAAEMSQRLDQLGWTKVLVDVRAHLPSVSRYLERSSKSSDTESSSSESQPLLSRQESSSSSTSSFTAKELLQKYGGGRLQTLPLGHTVLVANAKDAFNRWATQGGKPTMDHLARNLIAGLNTDDDGP